MLNMVLPCSLVFIQHGWGPVSQLCTMLLWKIHLLIATPSKMYSQIVTANSPQSILFCCIRQFVSTIFLENVIFVA